MTYDTAPPIDRRDATEAPRWLLAPIAIAWLLMLITFSLPGRDESSQTGSLDAIALGKLAVRLIALIILGYVLVRFRNRPNWPVVLGCMLPLGLFLAWAVLSVAWSPLRTVSLGQAGGLIVQVLLAAAVAILWRTSADTSTILRHLSVALFVIACLVVAVDFIRPDLSGLTRGMDSELSEGLIHPTSAGATASLGLCILVLCRLIWNWPWTRVLLIPGCIIHSVLLYLAASRMALVLAAVIVPIAIALFARRAFVMATVFASCCIAPVYLSLDPHLDRLSAFFESGEQYVKRGESAESLQSLTGRTALWEEVWRQFQRSPWIGYGYFVTAKDGLLDVWDEPSNRTAHNLLLQVAASTGLIGTVLFLFAMGWMFARIAPALRSATESKQLTIFFLFLGSWYFAWCQLCASFMGPVRPESVVFFALLGLALGQLRASPHNAATKAREFMVEASKPSQTHTFVQTT